MTGARREAQTGRALRLDGRSCAVLTGCSMEAGGGRNREVLREAPQTSGGAQAGVYTASEPGHRFLGALARHACGVRREQGCLARVTDAVRLSYSALLIQRREW